MNFEGHVTLTKENGGIRMRCSIIEKLGNFFSMVACVPFNCLEVMVLRAAIIVPSIS